jgi:hypothetical protein
MSQVEMVLQFIESGSNSMSTYQALQNAAQSPSDALSVFQNGSNLIATVSNITPILQPIRIKTNGLAATSALLRIVTDWKDPNKRVQPGDMLAVVSAAGTIAITLLVWAEIGPGAVAAISAVSLAADLQSSFQPYMSSAKIWLGNYMSNLVQISQPASIASASLYWAAPSDFSGYMLASYDEIMTTKGMFVCLSDDQTSGGILRPSTTPVPGSFTPVSEAQYKENYCRYLGEQASTTDMASWLDYCMNVKFR